MAPWHCLMLNSSICDCHFLGVSNVERHFTNTNKSNDYIEDMGMRSIKADYGGNEESRIEFLRQNDAVVIKQNLHRRMAVSTSEDVHHYELVQAQEQVESLFLRINAHVLSFDLIHDLTQMLNRNNELSLLYRKE
eukprot:249223_1